MKTPKQATNLLAVEQAAIALRVTGSGTEWLDDMIRAAAKRDAEVAITCAIISRYGLDAIDTSAGLCLQEVAASVAENVINWGKE